MKGQVDCPNWVGRSKVMFRRKEFSTMNIHGGQPVPNRTPGQIHFDTEVAHIKEWRGYYEQGNELARVKKSFEVPATPDHSYEMTLDGKYTMHFDADLQGWFDFVVGKTVATKN
jgi:hypothetical protein